MAEIPDEELMIRFQQGDVHSFELLFEKYRVPVFNFLYRLLNREREPAEDLLQQIFIKLSKAGDFYEPRAKFSTWLFAIARNHCLNFLRSKKYLQQNTSSIDASKTGDETSNSFLVARDLGEMKQRETVEIIERAINALPEKYKEVFLLHAVEGFGYQETAEILKLNPATVRTHYHRARKMLRDAIDGIVK